MSAEWPIAYPGVPLARHSVLVAKVSLGLFEEDLRVLSRRLRKDRLGSSGLQSLLAGASLLHDVGKASNYYRNRNSLASGRISFHMHETAWSLVVYSVARRVLDLQGDTKTFHYLDFAAKVVARHHAAMECRHPVDLVRQCPGRLDVAKKVIEKLDADTVAELLNGLRGSARELGVPDDAWGVLSDRNLLEKAKAEAVKNAGRDIAGLASVGESFTTVAALSGMLIVADVVTASFCESRTSDDRAAPAYALHWRNELAGRISRLLAECPGQGL